MFGWMDGYLQDTSMKVAIVGAGIAGLACADRLAAHGCAVRLFDKGRGFGGRMSTRRMETPLGDAYFDHGAQYFTARDPRFRKLVEQWQSHGLVAPWPAAGSDALVGVPGMNAVVRHMARAHDAQVGTTVKAIERVDGHWYVRSDRDRDGPFDTIVLAVPAEQAAPLLSLHDFAMGRAALRRHSMPCWTAMLAFDRPLPVADDVLRGDGIVQWAARNNAKPGRTGPESWVVQASADWSAQTCEEEPANILPRLVSAFEEQFDLSLPEPLAAAAHRWRFARAPGPGDEILWNRDKQLGACGDWLIGPRVECAWLSGHLLGDAIAASVSVALQAR